MKIDKQTKKELINLWKTKKIGLEGNIIKVIDAEDDEDFAQYLKEVLEKDTTSRRKRLEITRQVQTQNNELTNWKEENEKIQSELVESLKQTEISMHESERLRDEAERSMLEAETAKEEALLAKEEAENAKEEAENAKIVAENDLDLIQKKTQFELIGSIVKVALWVILGVGFVVTGMYLFAIFMDKDTQVIGSTWSNIVGILLTNAFSIVGTIMGVKYASESKKE